MSNTLSCQAIIKIFHKSVTILLRQHIGAPATPVVKVGDSVKRGTLLAAPEKLGANVHSSVDGVVKEITEEAVIVEASEKQSDDYVKIEGENTLDLIKAAGIVGMGGAGFPTAVKLNIDLKGGYILVNAAECEPLPEKTLRGIDYCMKVTNAAKGVIAIKKKHEEEIKVLLSLQDKFPNISIHLLPDIYPMGEERAVVREVLGKLLPPTSLPSEADSVWKPVSVWQKPLRIRSLAS